MTKSKRKPKKRKKTIKLFDLSQVGSAYEHIPIGAKMIKLGVVYELVAKWRMAPYWHKCPYCGNHKTWHQEVTQHGVLMNVYRTESRYFPGKDRTQFMTGSKFNLCFRCGREWMMEMFLHKEIGDQSEFNIQWPKIKRKRKKR